MALNGTWSVLDKRKIWNAFFTQEPHSVTSQEMESFIVTSVKTSNLA
jgi:hypothetical protein